MFGDARMVPILPCRDIDEVAGSWTALGLAVTYRQLRPNPYIALRRNAIELHYYGMEGWDPSGSHSTCSVVVDDTESLHRLFVSGFRERYGRVRLSGLPRITRPRRRANNAGLKAPASSPRLVTGSASAGDRMTSWSPGPSTTGRRGSRQVADR